MNAAALGSLLAALLLAVAMLLGAGGVATARARAQAAADAAALAAMGAAPLAGGDGAACTAARAAAAANGATLLRCDGPGAAWSLAVDVEVALPVLVLARSAPAGVLPPVRARAAAVLEPADVARRARAP